METDVQIIGRSIYYKTEDQFCYPLELVLLYELPIFLFGGFQSFIVYYKTEIKCVCVRYYGCTHFLKQK